MKTRNYHRKEILSEQLNVQHKIAESTEKRTYHLHEDLEIIYALSDNLLFCTENDRTPIPGGSLVLIDSMTLHHIDYVRDAGLCDRYVLYFKPDLIAGLDSPEVNLLGCFVHQNEGAIILELPPQTGATIRSILDEMESVCLDMEKDPLKSTYDLHVDRLMLKLLLIRTLIPVNKLYREQIGIPNSPHYEAHSRLVMDICSYIDSHCHEDITMDSLSRQFLISKTQLFNVFKEILRVSAGEYIALARFTKAKHYLINTDYSVEIISQKVGYSNIASFSRVFKEKVGLSPLQYRKKQRT